MSTLEDKVDLKGGHAPAVKAGGKRVVTRHRQSSQGDKHDVEVDEEFPEPEPVSKSEARNKEQNVSGAVTKGDKDFNASAVKNFHEKPIQNHEKRPVNSSNQRIQQP